LANPEPIAQRFAYVADLRQSALRPVQPSRPSAPEEPRAAPREAPVSAQGRSPGRTRWLIAGPTLALLASLIAGAVWLDPFGLVRSTAALAPEPPAAMPSAVLTTPDRIKAVAGETVSFPIALDGTDGVPPRSTIALRGLPPGSNLSEGRPYGRGEWTLRPDQIGDLALVAPVSAKGEFKLAVALIAPDDSIVAEAETLLEMAPAPVPAEAAATEPGIGGAVPEAGDATAAVPDQGEAAAAALAPEAEGEGAAPNEMPALAEAEAAPSAESPSENAAPSGEAAPSSGSKPEAEDQAEPAKSALGTVQPSVFVNMREAPSSSAPVLGVIAQGATLPVLDRKRGWVQVTHPESGKQGWIYSGLLAGEAKPDQRIRRVAPAEAAPKSESFWDRMGRWLTPG
jgi:hypothetical protein